MDKKSFAELVRQQITLQPQAEATQPEELARHFLAHVAGGTVNYPPGFINGYFSSFYLGPVGGGGGFDKLETKPQNPN